MKNYLIILSFLSALAIAGCTEESVVVNSDPVAQTDMENVNCWMNPQTIVKCDAHSGLYACKLDANLVYGFGYLNSFDKINTKIPKTAVVEFWAKVSGSADGLNLVVSIDSLEAHKFWIGRPLQKYFGKTNNWEQITETINLPVSGLKPYDNLAAYIWNPGKKDIIYDDFKVTLIY